uniref:Proline and serine rich 2 n=1 Tax=Leptobrachium leishanense TaxID=445787 RepID=A0A8C5N1Z5_9ANUR
MDDENLKYLTNEEKNALLFFEETIDAFEEYDDPPFSLNASYGYSPRSTDDSHSETEDIIDLVQLDHGHVEEDILHEDRISTPKNSVQPRSVIPVNSSKTVSTMAIPNSEAYCPDLPGENRRFLGAVPTPVVIAQKISEKNADIVSPSSLRETKPVELKSVGTSPISEERFIFPSAQSAINTRFPTNIHINPVGKNYNKTISKAAVNVQERKAQVLANLNGPTLHADEIDGKCHRDQLSRSRNIPTTPKSPTSNGLYTPKFPLPDLPRKQQKLPKPQDARRSFSSQRPNGFRPQGITVQFSGRHASDECRKEALRKLGLLKEHEQITGNISSTMR